MDHQREYWAKQAGGGGGGHRVALRQSTPGSAESERRATEKISISRGSSGADKER